jgi:general secretion pathway protein J
MIRWTSRGFTLIEMLSALLIFSLLALMSYRGLGAVLDARDHVGREAEKWRQLGAFLSRFEGDLNMAAPRPVRRAAGMAPAWVATPESRDGPLLEFSRFAAEEGGDRPRRVAYRLGPDQAVELWWWMGLDPAPEATPVRHPVLRGVADFELLYLGSDPAWVSRWPVSPGDTAIPRAVRLRLVLVSGEEIVRVFALHS